MFCVWRIYCRPTVIVAGRYILSPLHLLSLETIYAGARGAYCHPKAYIVARMNFLPCIYLRRRENVSKYAAYIVAPDYKTFKGIFE